MHPLDELRHSSRHKLGDVLRNIVSASHDGSFNEKVGVDEKYSPNAALLSGVLSLSCRASANGRTDFYTSLRMTTTARASE